MPEHSNFLQLSYFLQCTQSSGDETQPPMLATNLPFYLSFCKEGGTEEMWVSGSFVMSQFKPRSGKNLITTAFIHDKNPKTWKASREKTDKMKLQWTVLKEESKRLFHWCSALQSGHLTWPRTKCLKEGVGKYLKSLDEASYHASTGSLELRLTA